MLDNFTDVLILNTAINKGKTENENVLISAFENSRYSLGDDDQLEAFNYSIAIDKILNNIEYSRYWHGIQTFLRPLLLVLNYEEIKAFLMIFMMLLLLLSAVYIYKNLSILHSLAYVFSMVVVGFLIVSISLQYFGVFAITALFVIIANIIYEHKKSNLYPYMFFIIGGLTTFYDLLTVPLITLGIPLIIVLLLESKDNDLSFKHLFIYMFKFSIAWGMAYATIFISKWIIATIIVDKNAFITAVNQLVFRIGGSEEIPVTPAEALRNNLMYLFNNSYLAIAFILIIVYLIGLILFRKSKINFPIITILLIISLFPYVWYIVFSGHSSMHCWFTYRAQMVTIFAINSILIETIDLNKTKKDLNIISNKNK